MRPLNCLTATAPSGVARLSVIAVAMNNADALRVTVDGELDMSNATWFAGVFTDMVELPGRWVRIDLSGLRFLDAAGIRALLVCSRHATTHGRELTVTDPRPIVRRILEITGLLHLVSPSDSDQRQAAVPERTG